MEQKEKNFKKDCLIKDLQIVLWGLLSLLFAVFLIFECIPTEQARIAVKEPMGVSSALINKTQKNYTCAISGILYNPSDDVVKVDQITVTVKGESAGREVDIEGFVLPPRTERELYLAWESQDSFTRVVRVVVEVDGESVELTNLQYPVEQGPVLVMGILLALSVLLLVRAAKGRYYLWQESQIG